MCKVIVLVIRICKHIHPYNVVKIERWVREHNCVFKYFKSCQKEEELGFFRVELVAKGGSVEVYSFRMKKKLLS